VFFFFNQLESLLSLVLVSAKNELHYRYYTKMKMKTKDCPVRCTTTTKVGYQKFPKRKLLGRQGRKVFGFDFNWSH